MDVCDNIERVLAGEVAAFQPLVEAEQAGVWRLVSYLLQGADATDDVVQEAFLLAYRHLEKFDPARGDFGAWVRTIARNCVRKHLRGTGREHERRQRYRAIVEDRLRARAEVDDHEALLVEAQLAALRRCREQLGGDAGRIIALYYEEQADIGTTARSLQRTEAACRKLLSRVRQKLRGCIELHLRQSGANV